MFPAPKPPATMIYVPVSLSSCEPRSHQAACWGVGVGGQLLLLSVSNSDQTYRPHGPGIRLPGGQGQRAGQQGLETQEALRVNWMQGRRPGLV